MIVYLETNFIIGAATGQDADADRLLLIPAQDLLRVVPDVCIMEAWSVLEHKRTISNRFDLELGSQITQHKRDTTSINANSMLTHLEQARIDNGSVFNDTERRLRETLAKLCGMTAGYDAAELLPLAQIALVQSLGPESLREPTDNLILAMVLTHARQHQGTEKILLSGNTKDFGDLSIKSLFKGAGIQYFAKTQDFLGWFHSRP